MPAYEVISGAVTNPSTTITALTTTASGDSFSVRSFPSAERAYLDMIWGKGGTAGIVRVRSPRLHDQAQGIRLLRLANDASPLLPLEVLQPIYPQDVLTVEGTGGAAETDVACLMLYYNNLGGVAARLATWDEIAPRVVNIVGVEVDVTSSATIGAWGPASAINATMDTLIANTDYAVLGYETSASVAAVTVRGVDTGNLRVGGPGTSTRIETRAWFSNLSRMTGLPHIPILNAANKGGILVDVLDSAASTAVNVAFVLAELQ